MNKPNYSHLWHAAHVALMKKIQKLGDAIDINGVRFFWNEKDCSDWIVIFPLVRGLFQLKHILECRGSEEFALEILQLLEIQPTPSEVWNLPPGVPEDIRSKFSQYIGQPVTVELLEKISADLLSMRSEIHAVPPRARIPRESIDGCTEVDCPRCRTAPALRTSDMHHTGIGSYPSKDAVVPSTSRRRPRLFPEPPKQNI